MKFQYLPINKENIKYKPEKFLINIENTELLFIIEWNVEDKNFYTNIYEPNGEAIVEGKRIVYGQNILEDIISDYMPNNIYIIVEDFSGEARQKGITFDNFMENVKPYIFIGSDS